MPANRISSLAALMGFWVVTATGAAQTTATPKALETYGPNLSFYRVGFTEFLPTDSALTFSDVFLNVSTSHARYPTSESLAQFVAVPHLPSGALVSGVEFDWCDTNASSDANFYVLQTLYTGENETLIGSTSSNGSAGCEYSIAEISPPFTVDNNHTQLLLSAFLPETDGSVAIAGAIVRYQLQVSPAPATATFTDVPVSHPFFQFVEALAASGITGGCGAGKFCPNDPVTRGQMAVFLSKALGLEFP